MVIAFRQVEWMERHLFWTRRLRSILSDGPFLTKWENASLFPSEPFWLETYEADQN